MKYLPLKCPITDYFLIEILTNYEIRFEHFQFKHHFKNVFIYNLVKYKHAFKFSGPGAA